MRAACPYGGRRCTRRLAEFDIILVVGMDLLRLYIHQEPPRPMPEQVRLIHLDADPWQIGKNYPVEVGLVGDPKAGLAELAQHLAELLSAEQIQAAAERRGAHAVRRRAEQEALLVRDRQPVGPAAHDALRLYGRAVPRPAAGCRRGGGSRYHAPVPAGEAGRAEGSQRLHRPSRLGPGLGAGLRHGRQAGLARPAGRGPVR